MWNIPDRKGVGNGDYRRFVLAWGGGHPDEHRNPVADGEVKKIGWAAPSMRQPQSQCMDGSTHSVNIGMANSIMGRVFRPRFGEVRSWSSPLVRRIVVGILEIPYSVVMTQLELGAPHTGLAE
jgi:hypothetical protein